MSIGDGTPETPEGAEDPPLDDHSAYLQHRFCGVVLMIPGTIKEVLTGPDIANHLSIPAGYFLITGRG